MTAEVSALNVLDFWFVQCKPEQWLTKDPLFDAEIAFRFGETLKRAAAGELEAWRDTAQGKLAEIIVLDQFSRNIYRDDARAFAQDVVALVLSQEAVRQGALIELDQTQRAFLLMPYMHSESRYVHELAEPLFKAHTAAMNYDYEILHKRIIDRFGRYPHRNAVLGRQSTAEELAFLQEPNSSF